MAVQGVGKVGSHLVKHLLDAGATVVVADVDDAAAQRVVRSLGVVAVDPEKVHAEECDVFAPCALGGTVRDDTVPAMRCRIVCGAANNQLERPDHADMLAAQGILYAPDYVVNAGGIINIAEEFVGYDRDRALARTAEIANTTAKVLATAVERDITPVRAAEQIARQRIAEEGSSRRWQRGDPAAWTNGEPLRSLRPVSAEPP